MPSFAPGKTDLQQARTEWTLAGDERSASGRAGLLAIPVGEQRAFLRESVNVGRLVAHHATMITTRVIPPDVITPEDEDVGLLVGCLRECRYKREHGGKDSGRYSFHDCLEGRFDLSWAALVAVEKRDS